MRRESRLVRLRHDAKSGKFALNLSDERRLTVPSLPSRPSRRPTSPESWRQEKDCPEKSALPTTSSRALSGLRPSS